jgi:hypothetical protein
MSPQGAARHSVKHSRVRERWERIIAAMLVCRSDVEAAARAGVSRSSLARAKKLPEFQADLQAAKDAQLQSAVDSLRGNANKFVDTLTEIAGDNKQHGNARVRAAEVGMNALARFIEMEDVLRRLSALEEVAGGEK